MFNGDSTGDPEAAGSARSPASAGTARMFSMARRSYTACDGGRQTDRHDREPEGRALLPADRRRHPPAVLFGPPARPGVDCPPRISDVPRSRHPDSRALLARADALELQVPL